MNTKVYNKLVRDRIPEMIERSGDTCKTRILSDEEYIAACDEKLHEELAEYTAEPCIEELADMLEVLYAAASARGYSREELEQVRAQKEHKRGAFTKKILLIETSKVQ